MSEEPGRKQSKKLTFKTLKNANFWQQDITSDRKSFTFLKAYDLFLFLRKNWI